MFHFNQSLEGDSATNDMGRCDGGLQGPQAHTAPRVKRQGEGGGVRCKNPNTI